MSQFSNENLIAFLMGEAVPSASEAIELERQHSTELQGRLRDLEGLVRALPQLAETHAQFEVRRDLLERLKAIGQTAPSTARPTWDRLGELLLSLITDLKPGLTAAVGFRSAASDVRLLTFASGDIEVELHVKPRASLAGGRAREVSVIGKAEALAGAAVELTSLSGLTVKTDCDENGYFEVQVEPGEYSLRFHAGGGRVVIDSVDLRAE